MNSVPVSLLNHWFVRKRIAISLAVFVLVLPALLFIQHSWPEESFLDFTLDALGFAFIAVGVIGRLWCTLYIGGRKHEELQVTGPYSIVRHPLYLFSLCLALGLSALSENPLILLISVTYFTVQYFATIRHEETALRTKFGVVYEEYTRRVPCLLPSCRHWDSTSPGDVNIRALLKEMRASVFFLLAIPLMELITLLHEKGIVPYILFP